ncbi:MAG: SMI1/KNR4 family protein [Eikenella sp.]|nr:SMI1/KNR4 family protein [Eikenella sp.]
MDADHSLFACLYALLDAADPHIIDRAEEGGGRTDVGHHAAAPAGADDLARLAAWLNGADDALLALYRRHNGLQLFAREDDPLACLSFLPVGEMEAGKAALADWLQIDEDTLDEDELGAYTTAEGALAYYGFPDWWENAVVFAYFGYSPECLLMPADGEHSGKIFIFEHDGGDGISQIADNLGDLFRQLTEDSIGFLRRYYGMYWHAAASYRPE